MCFKVRGSEGNYERLPAQEIKPVRASCCTNRVKVIVSGIFLLAGIASIITSAVLLVRSDRFSYRGSDGTRYPTPEGIPLIIFGLFGGAITAIFPAICYFLRNRPVEERYRTSIA